MLVDEGIKVLQSCESELRKLLAQAAAQGDYDAALRLTQWARLLSAITASPHDLTTPTPSAGSATGPQASSKPSASSHQKRIKRRATRHGKHADYPRFLRLKDDLVKIGWSRRDRREYHHRSPYQYLSLLVNRLVDIGTAGRLFTSEELFPLHDADDGADVPSYQAYLCLAWLRQVGLVEPRGRQGYTVPETEGLPQKVQQLWAALPRK